MPDGEALASRMTDEWIREGYGHWNSDKYPDDAPHMIRLYGPDWRSMRPRVIAAFNEAVRLLNQILPTGRVEGYTTKKKRERKIKLHEWSSRRLNISRGLLEAPHLPAIPIVQLNREDLIREATAGDASPQLGKSSAKRSGTREEGYAADLRANPPNRLSKATWAARAVKRHPKWNKGTLVSWLSRAEGATLWRELGGA
jgi:hypothetical protein